MKVTKILNSIFLILVILTSACKEFNEGKMYDESLGRYVRFGLRTNSSGEPIYAPLVKNREGIIDTFEQNSLNTLKVPVLLTSEVLDEEVSIDFSVLVNGDFEDFTLSKGQFTFSGSELTDTMLIEFNERWPLDPPTAITLQLDASSDPSIKIGEPNTIATHDELTIKLNELFLTYNLSGWNIIEITGQKGETAIIEIEFPYGMFPSELEGQEAFEEVFSEFAYSIEQLPFEKGDNNLKYQFELLEELDEDRLEFRTTLQLKELEGYILTGNTEVVIKKPPLFERDLETNPAANFYNVTNPTYRLFGETWMDYNKDGECAWTKFNTFAYPIAVDANHPSAVLASDNDTDDPSDDIYYHAFRMGFNTPNAGRTTNSFNLKRLFPNYYGDEDKSPGFNVAQAFEFFPTDGTSKTDGTLMIIEQDLVISAKNDGPAYTITIGGEGVYKEISDGVFQLNFNLELTNDDFLGGTLTIPYEMYNTDYYERPDNLNENCYTPVEL